MDAAKLKRGKAMKLRDAADAYLVYLAETGGSNAKQKEQQLRDHLAPFFGDMRLADVRVTDLKRYQKRRLDAGAKPATVNREIAVLKHLYSTMVELGVIQAIPFKAKLLKEDNTRIVTFTEEEMIRALEAAKLDSDPYTHLFMLVGFNTGMRHMEILRLRFEQIDYVSKRAFVPEAKAGSRHQPIPAIALEALREEQQRRGVDEGWVFAAESETGHRSLMSKQFRRTVERARSLRQDLYAARDAPHLHYPAR